MKKKIFAIVSAAALFLMSTMPVFAATSPVAGTDGQKCDANYTNKTADEYKNNVSGITDGYQLEKVDEAVATEAEAAIVSNVLKDVFSFASAIGNKDLKAAATDKNKVVNAEILTVIKVDPTTATKVDNKYVFDLSISGVKEGDLVVAFHLPEGSTTWVREECIAGKDKVTVKSDTCSPFSITKITITTKSTNNNNKKNDDSTTPTSPKTGEAVPAALLISLAGLIGSAVCLRKAFEK